LGKTEASAETQARHVSGFTEEDRSSTAGTVGEGEGWEEVRMP